MPTSALTDWVVRRGAELHKVTVGRDAFGGRALCAAEDIAEGETVLRIPLPALLTVDLARRSPSGQALLAASREPPGAAALLTAYLLSERRAPSSSIAPYLACLPRSFPTVPLFCAPEVLPHLRGTLAASLLVKRREAVMREVLELKRAVPMLRDATLPELFWASTAVITRVFGITVRGSATEALVPFADMMNHRRPPELLWTYDEDGAAFTVRAARAVTAGEEVCGSYGRKANHRYFIHYGFAMTSGADDEAAVRLSVPAGMPRASTKAQALRRAYGQEDLRHISSRVRADATQRTLSFVRTACATNGEIGRALRALSNGDLVPPLSHRNEATALSLLHTACVESLARFDSPDEADDERALESPDLTPQVRHAILVRRGEKRLLHAWRRVADTAIPMLLGPRRAFFHAAVHHRGEGLTMSYLTDVAMALAPRDARRPPDPDAGP
ncbi:MAG: SET domain-containing histone-lysine N-methyltransferase [Polyangiaceae bacterium]